MDQASARAGVGVLVGAEAGAGVGGAGVAVGVGSSVQAAMSTAHPNRQQHDKRSHRPRIHSDAGTFP